MFSSLCVSSRSHGLHGAWQRAGRGGSGEKNGPAKPCKGRSDPQTRRLEEETPTATSFPQGAHAVLEQGEFRAVRGGKAGIRFCLAKRTIKLVIKQSATHRERLIPSTDSCEHLCVCVFPPDQLCVQLSVKSERCDSQENMSKSTSQYIKS